MKTKDEYNKRMDKEWMLKIINISHKYLTKYINNDPNVKPHDKYVQHLFDLGGVIKILEKYDE